MKNDKAASNSGTHHKTFKNDISSATQQLQILSYLKKYGSATTLEIRNELCILAPAPRILELRADGHFIETVWVDESTPDGKLHRIAKYVLKSLNTDMNKLNNKETTA